MGMEKKKRKKKKAKITIQWEVEAACHFFR